MNRAAPSRLVLAFLLPACAPGGAGGPAGEDGSSSGSTGPELTSSESDGSSSGSSASSSSTGEPPCPVGSLECPCTEGGFCDTGLTCELGTCVEGCAVGSLGCACTEGGGCDGGLVCASAVCIEGVSETCGDGIVDDFEECDAGEANSDGGACTSSCKVAVCGDGLVGPSEACDGGAACTEACALTTCGDGRLDAGEDCEPTGPDDVECSQICTDARKIIFVTSEMYKGGEIGGVAGGDAKCQGLAEAAGLAGEFKAWLATSKEDAPLVRFSWHLVPYVDTAGEVLAEDWTQLHTAAQLDEKGQLSPVSSQSCGGSARTAWSSDIDNVAHIADQFYDCAGWQNTQETGTVARLEDDSPSLNGVCAVACTSVAPIFCTEQ